MNRPSLALCMIIKNEESHLPRLFESFKDCFDEIHITDTGSTDNSVEIAKSLGATVHHFTWVNDFAAARNYSFSHAKSDYIMWIDGDDELVSAKGLKNFRDTIMSTADYWVCRYDYASDAKTGKSLCSFARERIVKRHKGMEWKYPIHEGILPVGGMSSVTTSYTNAFFIKHVRTQEDLEKDRSRNINLFKSLGDNLDARMRYYYGKELFEIGKPVEAAVELLKAMECKNLEFHDRVLAIQYACYSFMSCNQFERVIEIAHEGLKIAPGRAEFWCLLGDAYIKQNKLQEALPCFGAAKTCIMPSLDAPSALFFHENTYTNYPRNQISRIYANVGLIDCAYLEAKESLEKYPNDEARAIKEEIAKVKLASTAYKSATECTDIVITCPLVGSYRWDPEKAKSAHMGGSETAVMEMAKHMRAISKREVIVFNDRDDEKTFDDGVKYMPLSKMIEYFTKNKPFFHIAWRHTEKITDAPTFVWCHDLYAPGMERRDNYAKILALSPFHKKFLTGLGVTEEKIHVTRNGIRPERFSSKEFNKNPNKFIYSSSPDRGIDRAIKVLDKVRETNPNIELHAFYGIEQLKAHGRHDVYNELKTLIDSRPWVKFHGGVDQETLMKHMQESAVWLYPTNFLETSCITAMEMVGNGVYPIVRNYGALPDTLAKAKVEGMASILDMDCATDQEINLWAKEVEEVLAERRWERVRMDMKELGWEAVAQDWLRDLPTLG
jgi:glycosyltransferase involved in cell wall biosynthesis